MIRGISHKVLNAIYAACETEAQTNAAEIGMYYHGKVRQPIDATAPDAFSFINECIEAQAASGEVLTASLPLDLTDPREAGKKKLFSALALCFSLKMQVQITGSRCFADEIQRSECPPSALFEHGADVWCFWILKEPAVLTFSECKEMERNFLSKIVPAQVKIDGKPDLWNMRFPVSVSDPYTINPTAPRYTLQTFTEKQKKNVQPLKIYSAADLPQMDVTPPPFVVEGLLPAGMTIFAAPPKTGKSWACLDLCAAVANGAPFWGHNTTRGSVLYLDLEGRAYRLKSRFPLAGIEPPTGLAIAHDAEMLEGGLIEQLEQWCAVASDPRLIVIDTLARVKPGTGSKLDAYTRDTHILKPLQSFAVDKGLAIVLVTHLNKRGGGDFDGDAYERITGSNAQFGVADTAWTLKGERRTDSNKPSEYEFRATGRDIEDTSIQVIFEKCRWYPIGNTAEVMEQRRKESFFAHPIIKLIVRKVEESITHEWCATASDIMIEAQRIYGETPPEAADSRKLGHFIKRNAVDLFDKCGIIHEEPKYYDRKAGGRLHTFKKRA